MDLECYHKVHIDICMYIYLVTSKLVLSIFLTIILAGWVLANHEEQLVLGKIGNEPGMSATFHFSLTIEGDLTCKLHVLGVLVPPHNCICDSTPDTLSTVCDVQNLLTKVNSSTLCTGNPDSRFTEMVVKRKGVIRDRAGMQPVTSTCT